ncbi:hypothetical protein M409DRAFT_38093 [Zasmidium cellare ATCC 36951]|uniref:Amidase domain-containing protein n=1 Tax=Zasmidium cellare ATCC 36951 TaxID=1080233 RepID=A0A6A6BVD4_ZASCE|nr:uncharacterized protein M409DRAFT_38093 [Zasmidium cellare ATCC 36951]KAF2158764.1 hypothetical protein M409DRAFT_38093 [Zasmidium cellare ATCC 36951]
MSWKQVAQSQRETLLSSMPIEWRLAPDEIGGRTKQRKIVDFIAKRVSSDTREITELPVSQLLQKLRQGDVTASEVLAAFAHRAALAHQLTHCLSEYHYVDAKRRAAVLDEQWRMHQKPVGPLHGLPVSLMDRFHVAGLRSACGYVSWLGIPRTGDDEGVLVERLRTLGAVILCKTNVPVSAMMGETDNNIMGFTMNPFNRMLSAGGACGGEGALIALRGSPIGFGTDIAGSVRIPAAFNGLCALKASEQRLPDSGIAAIFPGLPTAAGSVGMLASELEGIQIVFKALQDSSPWTYDNEILELPWRKEKHESILARRCDPVGIEANGRLVFGVLQSDDHVNPHPPIRLALQKVKQALLSCGYEIVPWRPPPQNEAVENLFRIFGSTGAQEIRNAIDASGEPPVAQMRPWYEQQDNEDISTSSFWQLCEARDKYRRDYAKYWRQMDSQTTSGRRVDGVIQPVAPYVAGHQNDPQYYAYSAVANILDVPAAVFPVSPGFSLAEMAFEEAQNRLASNEEEVKIQKNYRPVDAQNMPVGLQVLGRRLQEEQVLAMGQAVIEALNRTA